MSNLDYGIFLFTLLSIVLYGIWKSRNVHNIQGFLLADKEMKGYQVGFSVMATQASAITFLAAPAQAYNEGLGFVQFYLGLPLAMIVICTSFVPLFQKLKVYTAYEFLEKRFDAKTRVLTASLFLLQRGISSGITIYAPALILATLLHLPLSLMIALSSLVVIFYTVYGGAKAVAYSQTFQMLIVFLGLMLAGFFAFWRLPQELSLPQALHIAGAMDKMRALDLTWDWHNKYNLWSGLIGGFFLQLSYFGTDQSQVGRYLTGASLRESRLGLIFNGLLKIPMQFSILMIGILVFVFYQFHRPPLFFNPAEVEKIENSIYQKEYESLDKAHQNIHAEKQKQVEALVAALQNGEDVQPLRTLLQEKEKEEKNLRKQAAALITANGSHAAAQDANYIFLYFVLQHLPIGFIGLLIAMVLLAGMGATASGLSALSATVSIDFYQRFFQKNKDAKTALRTSRLITAFWGLFSMAIAFYAQHLGNLIEAVNILGSLFYGTILGIFLSAFFLKKVDGNQVFYAALLTEGLILGLWHFDVVPFLWLNVVGALGVMVVSLLFWFFYRIFALK